MPVIVCSFPFKCRSTASTGRTAPSSSSASAPWGATSSRRPEIRRRWSSIDSGIYIPLCLRGIDTLQYPRDPRRIGAAATRRSAIFLAPTLAFGTSGCQRDCRLYGGLRAIRNTVSGTFSGRRVSFVFSIAPTTDADAAESSFKLSRSQTEPHSARCSWWLGGRSSCLRLRRSSGWHFRYLVVGALRRRSRCRGVAFNWSLLLTTAPECLGWLSGSIWRGFGLNLRRLHRLRVRERGSLL